ncbi:tyrosine-protein kinase STYK1-like isoform X2 [Polypterus senegalus]|nr:tyrosine-protein kinase STYK1-like isoform X2 [Polypterus senegalus]
MKKDLHRLGCYFNIPLAQPQNPAEVMFVKGTLQAMRFVTAANILQPELTEVLSRELWMRIWSRDEDITEPASFQAVATAIGLSKDQAIKLIEFSKSQEVKDSLKSTTQEALDNGAFGFPFIIAHVDSKKEVFFGSDRMELLAHCLERSSNATATSNTTSSVCPTGDTLCIVRVYETEVIVVPTLLVAGFIIIFTCILVLRFCPDCKNRGRHRKTQSTYGTTDNVYHVHHFQNDIALQESHGQMIDPLEIPHEKLQGEMKHLPLTASAEALMQRPSVISKAMVTLMQGDLVTQTDPLVKRRVVVRALNKLATPVEAQEFLSRARFEARLGKHPNIVEVLGVCTTGPPLQIIYEEIENQDLLSFLWKCRRDFMQMATEVPCDLTEKGIFRIAQEVACGLDYIHEKGYLHGDIAARSVLIGKDMSAKLSGFGRSYHCNRRGAPTWEGFNKWLAPERLAKRPATKRSDVWSFGVLLYEIITLGEAPFPDIACNEMLQHLQRGHTLKRPPNSSNALYTIIRGCCQWQQNKRPSLMDLKRRLQLGEKQANDQVILRVPEKISIGKYMKEAGLLQQENYAIL